LWAPPLGLEACESGIEILEKLPVKTGALARRCRGGFSGLPLGLGRGQRGYNSSGGANSRSEQAHEQALATPAALLLKGFLSEPVLVGTLFLYEPFLSLGLGSFKTYPCGGLADSLGLAPQDALQKVSLLGATQPPRGGKLPGAKFLGSSLWSL
jgi:hypothetical protein